MVLNLELLLGLGLIALLVSTILAPAESLMWWAGWYGSRDQLQAIDFEDDPSNNIDPEKIHCYLVYLTGIGGYSYNEFLPREQRLLKRLEHDLESIVVVDDIYPYSVNNKGLLDNRLLTRFWRWTVQLKERGNPLAFVINIRNLLQVAVAADNRYGPIYARGIAQVVIEGLQRHGYPFGKQVPIYLLGYSGGGEMSISAVGPLKETLGVPVYVLSLGGVISNDPNLDEVDHLYHLTGSKDRVHLIGPTIFPGRWPIARHSHWNRAVAAQRISFVSMGDMAHNGPGGYLDEDNRLETGETYLDKTVATLTGLMGLEVEVTQEAG